MTWAAKDFTKRRKGREQSFLCTFPREGKGLRGGVWDFLLDQNRERGLQLGSHGNCKPGGFSLIVQASVPFAVIFGFLVPALRSGTSCLYKF